MPSSVHSRDEWTTLSAGLTRLRQGWPSRGWSWDKRFSCATSSFSQEHEQAARRAAAEALPTEWTSRTVLEAPPVVRQLVTECGDLRSGQLLFTGGHLDGLFAFGLWWPWGNGDTISLRVGLAFVDAMEERSESFRRLFGVSIDG